MIWQWRFFPLVGTVNASMLLIRSIDNRDGFLYFADVFRWLA